MDLTQATLERLLQRGERARVAGSHRAIRESFKSPQSVYWSLALDQRDSLHARMKRAAADGAVRLEWSSQGGDDRPLDAVVLCDVDRLAHHLGRATVSAGVELARQRLSGWEAKHPAVTQLLSTWAAMRQVRSMGPESAADFADALHVIDYMSGVQGEDRVLRQVSIELFGDSKRIEQLFRQLDVLTSGPIGAAARHWEEVIGGLGLTKEPQPFLLAGSGAVILLQGERCPVVRPFVGVANQCVHGYDGTPAWVLTVENLTTFHLAAKACAERTDGLIIYTGGMPSPAWCRAFGRILESLPVEVPHYHWGDIDEGGFRIAAVLRHRSVDHRRPFLPWLMDPTNCGGHLITTQEPTANAMAAAAERAGWAALGQSIRAACVPTKCEQESVPIFLPTDRRPS